VAWYSDTAKRRVTVYRLYNPAETNKAASHHHTTDANERKRLIAGGKWRAEGVSWYAVAKKAVVPDS